MRMPIFGLVILVVLVGVAIAVIALLVGLARSGRGGRIAALVVGLVLMLSLVGLVFVGLYYVRSAHHVEQAEAVSHTRSVSVPPDPNLDVTALAQRHAQVAQDLDAWRTAASQDFEADIYPSLVAGSEALARQAADWIATLDSEPTKVQLALREQTINNQAAFDAARVALRRVMPAIPQAPEYEVKKGRFSADAEAWGLTVELDPPQRGSATERLVWKSGDRRWEGSVAVRDQPWVDDANWSGNAQLGTPTVVGYSDGLFADPAEAERSALASAARRMHRTLPERVTTGPESADPMRQLAVVEDVIHARELVRDRFVQRIDRPYGRLYRAAVLIDAGSETRGYVHAAVEQVGQAAAGAARAQQHRRFSQAVSVGVLAVLILLVYALLNALTKHYYLWPLRAAASFAAIVGLLLILMRV